MTDLKKCDFDKKIKSLKSIDFSKNKSCAPYISYLRFPLFKKLVEDLRIDFDFPITVLIGANGTSKTSILRAAYGAVEGHSISDFWYESTIDKITDCKKERSSIICGYYNGSVDRIVECLKQRTYSKKGNDYWETSRPIVKYQMEPLDSSTAGAEGRNATRWTPPKKEVLYIDFRHGMHGAYDRFFYFDRFIPTKKAKTKQDFIRIRSRHLGAVISNNKKSCVYNKLERVFENTELPPEVVNCVSEILGRAYADIRIVKHTFYVPDSKKITNNIANSEYTVYMKEENSSAEGYSEAFAGSGELAVILMVNEVLNASDRSLILLDEPEISLHPEAQKRIIDFLIDQTLNKKHQIIIATHSPYMFERLPRESLKLLYVNNEGKTDIATNVNPELAFARIGAPGQKNVIFVEDECASLLIKYFFDQNGYGEIFDIVVSPSGCDWLLQYMVSVNLEGRERVFFVLDGDQKRTELKRSCEIPENEWDEYLAKVFNKGVDKLKIANKKCTLENELKLKKNLIDYIYTHLMFLPAQTPEEFLYGVNNENVDGFSSKDYKDKLIKEAEDQFGDSVSYTLVTLIKQKLRKIDINADVDIIKEMNALTSEIVGLLPDGK